MRRILKFLLLVALLNAVRYAFGWPLEKLFVAEKLTAAIENNSDIFNWQFTAADWTRFYLFNFMSLFLISLIYLKIEPVVHGHPIWKSLKVYGVMFLYFATVSAAYMNQYNHPGDFYFYNILDRMLIFPVVAVANGVLYPRLFKDAAAEKHARTHGSMHSPLGEHFPGASHGAAGPSAGLHRL